MRQFIESLKRLYESKKINESYVVDLCEKGTININDKNYILGKEE